jgi:hypothetical protein
MNKSTWSWRLAIPEHPEHLYKNENACRDYWTLKNKNVNALYGCFADAVQIKCCGELNYKVLGETNNKQHPRVSTIAGDFAFHSSIVNLLDMDVLHREQTANKFVKSVFPPRDSGILCPH